MTYTYSSVVVADSAAPVVTKAVGTFTLSQNNTSTTVSIPGMTANSKIMVRHLTQNAGNIWPFTKGTCSPNVFSLTHPSNPNSDLDFEFVAELY